MDHSSRLEGSYVLRSKWILKKMWKIFQIYPNGTWKTYLRNEHDSNFRRSKSFKHMTYEHDFHLKQRIRCWGCWGTISILPPKKHTKSFRKKVKRLEKIWRFSLGNTLQGFPVKCHLISSDVILYRGRIHTAKHLQPAEGWSLCLTNRYIQLIVLRENIYK